MVYCANPFSQLVELFGKGNSIIGLRNIVPNDTVREFRLRSGKSEPVFSHH